MDRKPFNNGGTGTAFLWNFVQGGMDMATLEKINAFLKAVNAAAWGPPLLFLLLGTGIFLTIQLRALPIRRLFFALRTAFGREARYSGEKTEAGVSPFASLMTELAAEIGTGNIVGVASAMALGGPGALGWMILAAVVGLALKFSESFLSVQYRMQRKDGTYCGGPMVTLTRAFPGERLAKMLAVFFAGSAVLVSLGMGNMTQANSIALAMQDTFGVAREKSALVLTILLLLVVTGGLRSIAKAAEVLVPGMALFYLGGAGMVIGLHAGELPRTLLAIVRDAFSFRAASGGAVGAGISLLPPALRYGISRGVISNEAGLGAGGISAAAAQTDDPVRQGYISMTGVFVDTMVICLVTGLAVGVTGAAEGILEAEKADGAAMVIQAFESVFGPAGGYVVAVGILLFAFATMAGWAYQGEQAFLWLVKKDSFGMVYRVFFCFAAFAGCVCMAETVWNFAELANACMAVPNLLCVLRLWKEVKEEAFRFESRIKKAEQKKDRNT